MRAVVHTIASVVVLVMSVTPAAAEVGVWRSYGFDGEIVLRLAIDPAAPATLYAGTDARGLFKRTSVSDWSPIGPTSDSFGITSIALDPVMPSTLYVAAPGAGAEVFKSVDGGTSWDGFDVDPGGIMTLTIDPVSPSTIYAGNFAGRVLKSTDAGTTWVPMSTGLPGGSPLAGFAGDVRTIAVDPSTPTTLFAGLSGGVGLCPEYVEVFSSNDASRVLDLGWTGLAHGARGLSNGKMTFTLTCNATTPPCGVCTIGGPIQNLDADAIPGVDLRICSNDPSIHCTGDADCGPTGQCFYYLYGPQGSINARRCGNDSSHKCTSDAECLPFPCVLFAGPPLPLSAGGIGACVVNRVNGTMSGTANVESGAFQTSLNLISAVYNQIDFEEPCPQCTDPTPNDGTQGGICQGGARNGQPCDANGTSPLGTFGTTSLDCPPSGSPISSLPIALAGSSGTETKVLTAANPACTGAPGKKCFCPPQGSQPTVPNACLDDSLTPAVELCDPVVGNTTKGECKGGPIDQVCAPLETFRSCGSNADCPADGDTCESIARPCYLDNGVIGGSVTAIGMADPSLSSPTLASVFCVGSAGHPAMNTAAGLPGVGRLEMPIFMQPLALRQSASVWKTTNGGARWEASGFDMSSFSVPRALVIDPDTPTTVYAGTNVGVYKSTDSGDRWDLGFTGNVTALVMDPTAPATMYAGAYGSGVFKSTDGGVSWDPLNAGLGDKTIQALAIDPVAPGTLYAATNGGLFRIDQVATGGESVSAPVGAGASCSTDNDGPSGSPDGATVDDPIETTVYTPNAGLCGIDEQPATGTVVTGYSLFGQAVSITVPPASLTAPLQIVFVIDASLIPAGQTLNSIAFLKDGKAVKQCPGSDPCVVRREWIPANDPKGDVKLTIRSSSASVWSPVVPTLDSYLCYGAAASKGSPSVPAVAGIAFEDALQAKRADLVKLGALCLPTGRDGAPITDAATALQAVALKAGKVCSDTGLACRKKPDCAAPATCGAQAKLVARKNVTVLNAVGAMIVDATKPTTALLPSATSASPLPGVPNPALDTFTCYATKPHAKACIGDPTRGCESDDACGDAGPCFTGFPKDLTVRLEEPVATPGGKLFAVKKPTALCLPADVDGVARKVPDVALQCFAIAPAKKQPKHTPVLALPITTPPLGALQRDTKKEAELCVPSEAVVR